LKSSDRYVKVNAEKHSRQRIAKAESISNGKGEGIEIPYTHTSRWKNSWKVSLEFIPIFISCPRRGKPFPKELASHILEST